MDTNSPRSAVAAAVTGARHLRAARNGQDAAAAWRGERAAAVVVCDGCGAGAASEVGARLGAQLVIASLSRQLAAGVGAADPALWQQVREDVRGVLGQLTDALPGERAQVVHDHFLFTIVAAVAAGGEGAVWAIGDGVYAIEDRERVLGPYDDNQPPYLAYDLLGMPAPAHLETMQAPRGTIVVATDGFAELGLAWVREDAARYLSHPDALRRRLAVLARSDERIEWDARRIVRTPAPLQDDGAVAIVRWAEDAS